MPPRKKNVVESTETDAVVQQPQPKAKREKKVSKHKVVAIVTPEGIQGSFQPEKQRPLIVHLPIKTSDIQFHDQPIAYDPKPPGNPEAYDSAEIDPFSTEATYQFVPATPPLAELTREPPLNM